MKFFSRGRTKKFQRLCFDNISSDDQEIIWTYSVFPPESQGRVPEKYFKYFINKNAASGENKAFFSQPPAPPPPVPGRPTEAVFPAPGNPPRPVLRRPEKRRSKSMFVFFINRAFDQKYLAELVRHIWRLRSWGTFKVIIIPQCRMINIFWITQPPGRFFANGKNSPGFFRSPFPRTAARRFF
ncbi:MAG: hypothetical protein LBO05_14315 [Deltaproteobacteria bacterium]|jgi:hypothetical protein|nr:hypothetical protein [Deltaproteobacteria bacterium]